jgi:hypothetical protein
MERTILFEESEERAHAALPPRLEASTGAPIRLEWPSDYRVITQGFGGNSELYKAQGLPGHEGLDIRAPLGSKIYASADGYVEQIKRDDPSSGNWIAVQHSGGYKTIYAQLAKINVGKGESVQARQVIGIASNSGSSSGGHVHLGLALAGATANRLTHYPNDIIDPTPFLNYGEQTSPVVYPWPAGRCLKGTTGNALGAESLRLDLDANLEDVAKMRAAQPSLFLLTKLALTPVNGVLKPNEWMARVRPFLKRHTDMGVGYFEIHSTPNLTTHGYSTAWHSGREFASWWLDVYTLLKASYPLARFGFPALANGSGLAGVRADGDVFLQEADDASLAADWIGVQCYWSNWKQIEEGDPIGRLRRWHPNKLVFVTEYGNVNSLVDASAKEREHERFLAGLQNQAGIGAAFSAA